MTYVTKKKYLYSALSIFYFHGGLLDILWWKMICIFIQWNILFAAQLTSKFVSVVTQITIQE